MNVKLLTEHHLECLSLKGGCRGSSESTRVKMPNYRKSHALAHLVNNLGLKRHDNVLVSALLVFCSKGLDGVLVSDLVALLYLKICTIKTPSKHNVLIVPWYRVLFSSFFILEGGNLYILMDTSSEQYPI